MSVLSDDGFVFRSGTGLILVLHFTPVLPRRHFSFVLVLPSLRS